MPAFVSVFITTLIFYFKSSPILLSCYKSAFVSHFWFLTILLTYYLPIPVSHSRSPAVLLFCYILVLAIFSALSLPCHAFVFCCRILAFYCPFLYLNQLFFINLYLLEHSNDLCQMSLSFIYLLDLQSSFVYSRLLVHIIQIIITACIIWLILKTQVRF